MPRRWDELAAAMRRIGSADQPFGVLRAGTVVGGHVEVDDHEVRWPRSVAVNNS